MVTYGIIDHDINLTPLGQEPIAFRSDGFELYARFAAHPSQSARHELVGCVADMAVAGERVNLTTIRDGPFGTT